MMILRRAQQRHHDPRREQKAWLTFFPHDRTDGLADGFGALEIFDETRFPPGGGKPSQLDRDAEIVTYVREGALVCDDSLGGASVINAGEFRCLTAGRGLKHRATNASQTHWVHVFQIRLRPSLEGLEPSHEQRRFGIAERRGNLCLVVSPDGRKGSLRIHQNVFIFSALLEPGKHVVHELLPGRKAWLHLVQGEASLTETVLTTGDGAGITGELAVSLTAQERTEVLLIDLVDPGSEAN